MRHAAVLFLILVAAPVSGQEAKPETPTAARWIEPMRWRSIGPASMGGRITALAIDESHPSTWWVATASGGVLKTTNNGVSFEHQFDREKTVSIGDIAVAPSDPKIVWVGTGEANPRNSVSWGDGVYKSVDGGKTWKNMGLRGSFQVGAIRIHPKNPDIVYAGALGRLWGDDPERGLFKTTDGGKTWNKILFVDDKTGVIEITMHPSDPETMLVAMWERQRDSYDTNDPAKRWGPGSGLFKTTDGGKRFRKVTKGLPAVDVGRIGIDYYLQNPNIVYLVLDSKIIGKEPENAPYLGITGADADAGARLTRIVKEGPAAKAGLKVGDIVLSINEETVHSLNDLIRLARKHAAGDTVMVEVSRDRKSVSRELTFANRPKPKKGEKPRRSMFAAGLGGQRANLHEQQGEKGHDYGGVYRSEDGGDTWKRINSVNPRPMYFSEIRVDPNDDRRLWLAGIRLWHSEDGGKSFKNDGARGVHPDHHALWIDPRDSDHMILGTDGGIYLTWDRGKKWDHLNQVAIGQFYHVAVGPRRDYRVYGGLQDNGSWGGPSRVRHASGPLNPDWMMVGGGDGFRCRVDEHDPDRIYFESQMGGIGRRHLRSGERAFMRPRPAKGEKPLRFNWSTPFLLSNHNSKIYYTAANRVFRSLDRGNGLRAISPDITKTKKGSATALAESPRDANLLYVGTDDGALWATRDGGHTWNDLWPDPPEAPKADPAAEKKVAPAVKETAPDPQPVQPAARTDRPDRGRRLRTYIERMDTNSDGRVTSDEIGERGKNIFARLDANQDGAVDRAELDLALERRKERQTADRPAAKRKEPPAPKGKPIAELMPGRRWVSWIEPSRFRAERAYVVFDAHRSNDDLPYLFATEDGGATWRSLRANLPDDAGTTRVLREDLFNENLLYLGTEFGAWVSIDRGESWTSLNTNLPTVAVHHFAIHPTAGEIVAATHGRSLWVLDVTALRQITKETLAKDAFLFKPNSAVLWRPEPRRGGGRTFVGENPPRGAEFFFALKKKPSSVTLKVTTLDGKLVRELKPKARAGMQRVAWDLRSPPPAGPRGRFRRGRRVAPGTYRLVLAADGETLTQDFAVENDPAEEDTGWIVHEEHAEDLEADRLLNSRKRKFPGSPTGDY